MAMLLLASPALAWNIHQPADGTFWGVPYTSSANIDRLADRVFIGPAVNDDGMYWSTGCPTCGYGATNHTDWFELLEFQSYNGGAGVYSDDPFGQLVVLADPNSAAATMAVPVAALVVAAETVNGKTGSTVRAFDLTVINNTTTGQNPGAWAFYVEAHAVGTSKAITYGVEIEARNSIEATHWDPFYAPVVAGNIAGLELGAGAGLPATGQYPATVGIYFAANPMPWSTGILFFPGSVDASGPGGTIPAISMPPNFSLQWYTGANTLGASMTGDATGGTWIGGSTLHIPTALAFASWPFGTPLYYACFSAQIVIVVSIAPCR